MFVLKQVPMNAGEHKPQQTAGVVCSGAVPNVP